VLIALSLGGLRNAECKVSIELLFQEQRKKKQKKSEPEVEGNKDDIFGAGPSQARRRTKEGYAIYSEQELELNKGGMTDLCPFDCKCCY